VQTFLSIGAGPGIGYATAERFAKEGFRIILSARNLSRLSELAEKLKTQGYTVETQTVDASDPNSVEALIESTVERYGTLDVLHYNAANLRKETLAEQAITSFNSDLAVNVGGAMVAAQTAIKTMSAGNKGTILLTGGHFALTPNPEYVSLSLGKAGIRALAFALFEPSKALDVHVATVTVAAYVQPYSSEATAIGEEFWKLHTQAKDAWTVEAVYSV
jgi:short-subunit dehydrogenase